MRSVAEVRDRGQQRVLTFWLVLLAMLACVLHARAVSATEAFPATKPMARSSVVWQFQPTADQDARLTISPLPYGYDVSSMSAERRALHIVAPIVAGLSGGSASGRSGLTRPILLRVSRAVVATNTAGGMPSAAEAAELVRGAKPVGSALKGDAAHRAVSFAVDDIASKGTVFRTVGGDGVARTLVQAPGELNGVAGRFEWIVDGSGNLTHQMFVKGGSINGVPIKP